jgi:hypothetical protein
MENAPPNDNADAMPEAPRKWDPSMRPPTKPVDWAALAELWDEAAARPPVARSTYRATSRKPNL